MAANSAEQTLRLCRKSKPLERARASSGRLPTHIEEKQGCDECETNRSDQSHPPIHW